MTVWYFAVAGYPWQDYGRMAPVFCMFLAHIPRNR